MKNLIRKVKEICHRKWGWFPEVLFMPEVTRYAYCIKLYLKNCDLNRWNQSYVDTVNYLAYPLEGEFFFNWRKCGITIRSSSDHLVDGLIPAMRKGNWVGLYKVTKHYTPRNSGSDRLHWDDGMEVNLKLVRCIKVADDWSVLSIKQPKVLIEEINPEDLDGRGKSVSNH